MSKGKEILNGAKNLLIKDEEIENLSKQRMEICNNCELNSKTAVEYCKDCGCVLAIKTKSINSKCPIGKW